MNALCMLITARIIQRDTEYAVNLSVALQLQKKSNLFQTIDKHIQMYLLDIQVVEGRRSGCLVLTVFERKVKWLFLITLERRGSRVVASGYF